MTHTDLSNKTILITGASGGIGTAACFALAKQGAKLIVSGRDPARLDRLASEVEYATGAECVAAPADLGNADDVTALVDTAARQAGGTLDIVVNAAGTGAIKPIEALVPADIDALLAVNLRGAMLLSQAAVRVMAPHKSGHLLHVVGILGKAPMAHASAYCASKYGLAGFLAALRAEVARRHNLKITGLFLGGVDTAFWDNPAIEMKVQRDKMLRPDEAASAIVYALTQPAHLVLSELTLQPESHQL